MEWVPTQERKKMNTKYKTINKTETRTNGRNTYSVTIKDDIKPHQFEDYSFLEEVIFTESIKSIGEYAFAGCTSLRKIIIPDSVTTIGEGAFSDCEHLEVVHISENIDKICKYTFANCAFLEDIVVPSKVTDIDDHAFEGCATLINVQFSKHLRRIGNDAFKNCTNLENLYIPSSVLYIRDCAFKNCASLMTVTATLRPHYGDDVFKNCYKIRSLIIKPAGMKADMKYVKNIFHYFSEITLSDSCITEIEQSMFHGCTSLKTISIPDSVTRIGPCAFYKYTSIIKFTIPSGIKTIK